MLAWSLIVSFIKQQQTNGIVDMRVAYRRLFWKEPTRSFVLIVLRKSGHIEVPLNSGGSRSWANIPSDPSRLMTPGGQKSFFGFLRYYEGTKCQILTNR